MQLFSAHLQQKQSDVYLMCDNVICLLGSLRSSTAFILEVPLCFPTTNVLRLFFCFYGRKLLNTLPVEQTTANALSILENKLKELF